MHHAKLYINYSYLLCKWKLIYCKKKNKEKLIQEQLISHQLIQLTWPFSKLIKDLLSFELQWGWALLPWTITCWRWAFNQWWPWSYCDGHDHHDRSQISTDQLYPLVKRSSSSPIKSTPVKVIDYEHHESWSHSSWWCSGGSFSKSGSSTEKNGRHMQVRDHL